MTFRDWIEEARLHLRTTDGTENGVFLRRLSILGTNRPLPGFAPAAIGVRRNRELTILFCYPLVKHLPAMAAAELLKHELLHFIFGHVSDRLEKLKTAYGEQIVLIAADLVINQFCNEALLAKHGLPGVTIQDEEFGFPPNLTTAGYCELLAKPDSQGKRPIDKMDPNAANAFNQAAAVSADDLDELIKPCDEEEGSQQGHGRLTEVFLHGKDIDPETRDNIIVSAIERAREEATESGAKGCRGWACGEALEYIERFRRPPTISWQIYLRRMESRHTNVHRVTSRRRPSRRHPSYFGRVKRCGSAMWLGVDTSLSMGEEELKLVDPEIRAISQRDVHVTVAHVDAGVAKVEEYSPHKGLVEFAGRGGTDFSPLFFELDKLPMTLKPSFLVYFTDGYGCCSRYLDDVGATYDPTGPRPVKHPRGVETLWLLPEGCMSKEDFEKVVPFGHVVAIPPAEGDE